MRRRTGLALAITLLAGALSFGTASSASACSGARVQKLMRQSALEVINLRTYHLELKADKKSYAIGDTALLKVTVTRPAHEDPAQLGIEQEPPMSFPAEGVNVAVGLRVGDVFLFGHDISDENGKAQVRIKIMGYTPTGKATADAFAWKTAVDTPCAKLEENGYRHKDSIFTVLRNR